MARPFKVNRKKPYIITFNDMKISTEEKIDILNKHGFYFSYINEYKDFVRGNIWYLDGEFMKHGEK